MHGTIDIQRIQAKRQASRRIETALALISTGLNHRDRQIRAAILTELADTTAQSELLKKPVEQLDTIAMTVSALGRRLRDGFTYETLLELQTEARAIFARIANESRIG